MNTTRLLTSKSLLHHSRVERVALTSPRHRGFVEGLGCYSHTVGYDELEQLPPGERVVYVDFSASTPRSR